MRTLVLVHTNVKASAKTAHFDTAMYVYNHWLLRNACIYISYVEVRLLPKVLHGNSGCSVLVQYYTGGGQLIGINTYIVSFPNYY